MKFKQLQGNIWQVQSKISFRKEGIRDSTGKDWKFLSNPDNCFQICFDYASKLASLWDFNDYRAKQQLQYLLFPDGITYERKKHT